MTPKSQINLGSSNSEALWIKLRPRLTRHPFGKHLGELRRRLFVVFIVLLLGAAAGYVWRDALISLIQAPLHQRLYYFSPVGGLQFLIQLCVAAGLVLATPVAMYQLFRFLEPALPHAHSRRFAWLLLPASILLMATGVSFAYFICLPAALHFLGGIGEGHVTSLISALDYLGFVLIYLVGFAVLFQLPLLLLIVNRMTHLKPRSLLRFEPHVIIGIFLLSAILTPTPDPWNMAIMALPVVALYQVSILLIWAANRHRIPYHLIEVPEPLEAPGFKRPQIRRLVSMEDIRRSS